MMKIFNLQEQEEDWKSTQNNVDVVEEKSYSMVEDEAKKKLIQNIRQNLVNEPAINKKAPLPYQQDNI